MTAGNGKTLFNGLDAIATMLAAIKPGEFITPGRRPDPDQHIVGEATDAIKRLATLRDQMDAKLRPLAEEHRMLERKAQELLGGVTAVSQIAAVVGTEEFSAVAKRIDEISDESSEPGMITEIAENLLWFEVKKTFPEVVGKAAIGFNSKWQVYWTDVPSRRGHGGLGDLFSALKQGGVDFDIRRM